jgi:hypothetical protein
MDKFDLFLKNLDELLATQPYKLVGDAAAGYWMAVHAVRNAAHVAKYASQSDATPPVSRYSAIRFEVKP